MNAPIEYTIDKYNRIISVNASWHSFYSQNGGPRASNSFIGENLFQHIAGREVQMLYSTLLRHLRSSGKTLSFPFCCNSSTVRRDLYMTMIPKADDSVVFSNSVQAITPWCKKTDAEAPKLPEPLTLCSWCNKIKIDTWLEPQIVILKYGLFEAFETPKFVHGICSRCQSRVLSTLVDTETVKHPLDNGPTCVQRCAS